MIKLTLIGNDYKYEIENIIQLFFPAESVSEQAENCTAHITAQKDGDLAKVTVDISDKHFEKAQACACNDFERTLCALLYEILSEYTGIYPKWGIQTGVRPTKLLRSLKEKKGIEYAKDYFRSKLLVSDEKLNLAYDTMSIQDPLLSKILPRSFSLYISIPFCKSRCSYCSFISHDVSKSHKLIPDYVQLICRELEYTAKVARDIGLTLQTVYIGGGTPTAIEAEDLQRIIAAVYKYFDLSNLLEFTVEAGRPDTITKQKLDVIKASGADRISINPQTLNDNVLKEIRRNHTAKEFFDCYELALKTGFDNINTDLIAGLPTDTVESFKDTMDQIIGLSPACVTVHTLSIKRSSRLVYKGEAEYSPEGGVASQMLEISHNSLKNSGYLPYYMYRQSRMAGNNENIGWSKPGFGRGTNYFSGGCRCIY